MEHRHPQHDAIAATLRAWYTTSAPAMGVRVERRPLGQGIRRPPRIHDLMEEECSKASSVSKSRLPTPA